MNSKIDLEKYFYWTAYEFFAIFFLYALFSEIVFFSITGGWAILFSLILYVWIFPVLLCLLGFASWCSRYGNYINQKLFLILAILILIFQILAILFNASDCGDWGRRYYFIETIIYNKTPLCTEPALFGNSVRRYSISFRYIYYLLNFILVLLFIYGQRLSIKIEKQQKQQLRKARQEEIKDLAPIFIRAIQHTRTDGKPLDYSRVKIVGNLHCKNLYFENIYYFISVTNNPEYNCSKLTIERKQPTGNKIILSLNFRANFDTRPGLNNIMILKNHVSKNDRILLQFADSING